MRNGIRTLLIKKKQLRKKLLRLENTNIGANKEVQELLEQYQSSSLNTAATLAELIRRPELSYEILEPIDKNREFLGEDVMNKLILILNMMDILNASCNR